MSASTPSSRFSPRSLAPAELERLTVGREGLLDHLQAAVTGIVVSRQARFDLVLGPRGAGKSHVLGVLEGRLRRAPELRGRTVIAALPEPVHPLSLVQFLAQILREFPDDPELGPAAEALQSLQRQRDGDQERRAVQLIRGRLGDSSLVVLVEHLDELFDALGRQGQLRLRNILQTERRWSIVATSRSLIPAFTKYEAPFHGTFNLHRLDPLSAEQSRDMLAALADDGREPALAERLRTPRGLARVRAIHHVLGGNPRGMALMFRQLDVDRLDRFEHTLAALADDLEPYFREQIARLSPTQRAMVELLGESFRPLTVTELSEQSFTSQASTSGALRHLRSAGIVEVFELGRERYYELGDPLHRLAWADARPREAIATFARVVRRAHDGLRRTVPEAPDTLSFALADAWHHRRPDASLDSLAQPLRDAIADPAKLGDAVDELKRSSMIADADSVLACVVVERLTRELATAELERLVAREPAFVSDALITCSYRWLASQRELEPLAALARQLGEAPELPMAVLHAKTPREAVARMSAPERNLVRSILERHGDRDGLAALGLAGKRRA